MRAVLIDSKSRTVTDVEYNGDYKEIYRFTGCEIFTLVRGLPGGDDAYVDDEGLLHLTRDSMFFRIPWYPSPIAGNALILSCNEEGESEASKNDADFYRPHVSFMSMDAVWLSEQLNPTGFGTVSLYEMKK